MTYDSVYGSITSGWQQTEQGYEFKLTVPDNCASHIKIPGREPQTVMSGSYTFLQKK